MPFKDFISKVGIERLDFHIKCLGVSGNTMTHISQPDDAQAFIHQFPSIEAMTVPVQGLHTLMRRYNFPECTEKQTHGQFGCRIGILARSVDDQNTSLRGIFHINVTHPNTCTGNHLQFRCCLDHLFIHPGFRTRKDAVKRLNDAKNILVWKIGRKLNLYIPFLFQLF